MASEGKLMASEGKGEKPKFYETGVMRILDRTFAYPSKTNTLTVNSADALIYLRGERTNSPI